MLRRASDIATGICPSAWRRIRLSPTLRASSAGIGNARARTCRGKPKRRKQCLVTVSNIGDGRRMTPRRASRLPTMLEPLLWQVLLHLLLLQLLALLRQPPRTPRRRLDRTQTSEAVGGRRTFVFSNTRGDARDWHHRLEPQGGGGGQTMVGSRPFLLGRSRHNPTRRATGSVGIAAPGCWTLILASNCFLPFLTLDSPILVPHVLFIGIRRFVHQTVVLICPVVALHVGSVFVCRTLFLGVRKDALHECLRWCTVAVVVGCISARSQFADWSQQVHVFRFVFVFVFVAVVYCCVGVGM